MPKKIIIVGSGFAGVEAANQLASYSEYNVTVIDKNADFYFYPISLKQVSGWTDKNDFELDAGLFLDESVALIKEEVIDINPDEKMVATNESLRPYDHLILCTGGKSFIPSSIKVTKGSTVFSATNSDDIEKVLNKLAPNKEVVIMGGGPSGCELAAELADLRSNNDIDFDITIVDSSKRMVKNLRSSSSEKVESELKGLDVKIIKNFKVNKITKKTLVGDDQKINYDILINALGVSPAVPGDVVSRALSTNPKDKLSANSYGQLKPFKNIWGAGDCASNLDKNGNDIESTAQAAQKIGKTVAANIHRCVNKQELKSIKYFNKGTFIPLGEGRCVLEAPLFSFKGKMVDKLWWLFYGFMMPKSKLKLKIMKRAFIKPKTRNI